LADKADVECLRPSREGRHRQVGAFCANVGRDDNKPGPLRGALSSRNDGSSRLTGTNIEASQHGLVPLALCESAFPCRKPAMRPGATAPTCLAGSAQALGDRVGPGISITGAAAEWSAAATASTGRNYIFINV
jgi:hypothetical protein